MATTGEKRVGIRELKSKLSEHLSRGSRRFACRQNRRERLRTGVPRTRLGFWGGRNSTGAEAPVALLRPREANPARPPGQ